MGPNVLAAAANTMGDAIATVESATPYCPAMAWLPTTSRARKTSGGRHEKSATPRPWMRCGARPDRPAAATDCVGE